ncbi:MAG: hypothetical protein O3A20_10700, partial [Planctomycetota bacterium]|nr:hypothetical protein [Planctomycetota bacterium]
MFTPILTAALLALAPVAAQQLDDTGNLFPPTFGTTSSGGVFNGVGCGSGTTPTPMTANNGQAGNMFDVAVHGADITLECIDIHTSALINVDVEVWAVPGTCVGRDTGDMCAHGWVLIGTGSAIGLGTGTPTNINLTHPGAPYVFSANSTYGIYVTLIGATSIRYTNGTTLPGGPYAGTHCDISTYYGKPNYTPPCTLSPNTFSPREWNGTLYTELAGPAGPALAASGSCPGAMTLTATNCTANSSVAILYGSAGSFTKPSNPCGGLVLGIQNPTLGAMLGTDGAGAAALTFNAP